MKFLVFLFLTNGLVSCIQVPESVTDDLVDAAQQRNGELNDDYDKDDEYGDDEYHHSHRGHKCTNFPFVQDGFKEWNGQDGGVEIGMGGEVLGDATKPGRVVIHEGGQFSYGWRDRVVGEVYANEGALVTNPRHADIYADDGSTIDLANGRDVLVYAEYGAQVVNQEYCRSCAVYYEDHIDVDRGCR
jgi:hypothetical protein